MAGERVTLKFRNETRADVHLRRYRTEMTDTIPSGRALVLFKVPVEQLTYYKRTAAALGVKLLRVRDEAPAVEPTPEPAAPVAPEAVPAPEPVVAEAPAPEPVKPPRVPSSVRRRARGEG